MRLKYYKMCLKNTKGIKKKSVVLVIFIVLIVLFVYIINNNLEPKVIALCDSSARSMAVRTTNRVINEKIQNIEYSDLVKLKEDSNGKITAINANVLELNKIASDVALEVQQKLNEVEDTTIKFPVASVFGNGIFSGYGPKLIVKVVPTGSVSVGFKSEFEDCGINQTRHKISIDVKTNVRIIAPFFSKTNEYINEIVIAESVIIGDVPASYYNLTGIEDLNKIDTVDFVEN